MDENLKNLKTLLDALHSDHLGKADFEKSVEVVIDYVKKMEAKNNQVLEMMEELLTKKLEENKSDYETRKQEMRGEVDNHKMTMEEMHKMMKSEVDMKMSEVRNGKDADEEVVAQKVCEMIKIPTIDELKNDLPKMGFQVRDALELLSGHEKLKIDAIDELRETLEGLLSKSISKVVGGGGFSKIAMDSHIIDDETPTGTKNGVNTDFIIAHAPNPLSSLKVYRGGTRQRLTEDYTFLGKTITFIIPPVSGEIILVDYRK